LEEPPGHALFVLCTTDPEKLPKTIISRCHRLNFKRATDKEIVERLKKICSQEKLKCDQEALEEIARLADGDFRDAVKILGQVSLGGSVSVEEVKKVAGILGEFSVEDFLALLAKKKAKESLVWINQAVEQGVNLRVLLESLLETLRQMMLSGFGLGEGTPKIELNGEEIKTLIELFSRAYFELKSAVIPQLPIEMAIVEWAEDKEDKKEDSDEGSKSEIKEQEVKALEAVESPLKLEEVITKWPAILEEVKPLNHSVQAFLKASRPLACQGEFLILEVFYKFHKDQLETEKCRRIFEKGASKVLGLPIKLKCSLSESQRSAKPLPVIEQLAPAPNMETKAGASQVAEGAEDDIIKFAEEIFNKGGTIQ
jgi:DNA polymerase-3 subunit gamma/tau